jgi:hypothetical protein
MEPYQYETLHQDRQEIRVFRHVADLPDRTMFMEMKTISLLQPEHQAYITVSYVWGNPAMAIPIVVNGQQLFITQSVHELLEVLLRTDEFDGPLTATDIRTSWWWIDSICINQQDLADRASQVRLMGKIYKTSSLTIAYTGPSYDESDLAIRRMRRATAQEADPVRAIVSQAEASAMEMAFWHFHVRPWFSRAWILQEWILPKTIVVLTGTTFFQGEVLEGAIKKSFLARSTQLLDRMTLRQVFHATSFVPFFRVIIAISRLAATDSRDVIYAILGIIRDAGHLVSFPDYSAPVSQVYGSIIYHYAKKYGRLDILCLNQWQKSRTDLPSWIPDLHTAVHLQCHTMVVDNIHIIESVSLSTAQDANVNTTSKSSTVLYNERRQVQPDLFRPPVEIDGAILRDYKIPWGYRADGGSFAKVSATPNFGVLTVSGIWLSLVMSLGAHLIYENTKAELQGQIPQYNPVGTLPLEQPFDLPCPYKSDDVVREAFVRTVRLCPCSSKHCYSYACFCQWDKRIEFRPCDDGETNLFTEFVQGIDGSHRSGKDRKAWENWIIKWWLLNKNFRVGTKSLEELFLEAPRVERKGLGEPGLVGPPPPPHVRLLGAMSRFLHVITKMNRRLMVHRYGGIGMVPHEARIGDRVCVIIGCSIPLLLRKTGECWRIIGEVFMYGPVMQAAAIRMAQDGRLQVEDISLC